MRKKISIIGAGNAGSACALRIAERGYADIVLANKNPDMAQGKVLDILQSAPTLKFDSNIIGTSSYEETSNSDVVIITAGIASKPGMTSRADLLPDNIPTVTEITRNVVKFSPDCIIVMVTNPVEAMTYLAIEVGKLPPNRVFGLSGALDGARLSSFIAAELNVPVTDVSSCVLGEHGNNMVIIPRLCTVNGIPITRILPQETIDRLVKKTIEGGIEVGELTKPRGAFFAASAAAVLMAEATILDKKQILPCAAYLQGEYGIKETVTGVPVKLGRNGIEQIIELDLTSDEKAQLTASAEAVRQLIETMKQNMGRE